MAVKLFKLVLEATTTTETLINPTIHRYFYEFDAGDLGEEDEVDVLTILAADFVDDKGDSPEEIETVTSENGYYLLFVNGVLQQSDLYEVEDDGSKVTVNEAADINPGAPITLNIVKYVPSSDSETSVVA